MFVPGVEDTDEEDPEGDDTLPVKDDGSLPTPASQGARVNVSLVEHAHH